MSRPDDSLIARQAAQVAAAPPLFSADVLEALTSAEARGEYTGERLFSQRPDIYRATVELLGQGVGVRQIARTLRVSHNTIAAVRHREGATVDTLKEATVQALARFVGAASERLLEEVHAIKLESLPVALGIATEKLLLLTGQATQRVAHVDEAPQVPAFADWLTERRADAIEIPSEVAPKEGAAMGYLGEVRGQTAMQAQGTADADRGADAGTGSQATDGAAQGVPARAADSESAALPQVYSGEGACDTDLDTDAAAKPARGRAAGRARSRQNRAALQRGGGGLRIYEAPPPVALISPFGISDKDL